MQQLPETEVAGKSAEKYKLRYTIMQMQEEYARNVTTATIRKMYVLRVKNVTAATIRSIINCLMYRIMHEVIFFIC